MRFVFIVECSAAGARVDDDDDGVGVGVVGADDADDADVFLV
jgi:hypothetical protein